MNQQLIEFKNIIIFLALIFITFPVYAAPAGKANMVIGKVTATSSTGETRRLRRGKPVYVGDIINTTERGQAQLIMTDGSNISVRPGSKFQVEEFVATGDVEKDKTYYKLLQGGFRSVTGTIGKKNKASFQLATPVATMGIRGTDFTAKYCDSNCPAAKGKNGLFVDVIYGGVSMTNAGGTFNLDPETNGYVADASSAPGKIAELPENLLSPKARHKDSKGKDGKKVKYPSPEEEFVQVSLYVAPEQKDAILTEAMDAGVSLKEIIKGADNAGLPAKDYMPDLIKKGKNKGISASDFVPPLLDSGIDADDIIQDMMRKNPENAIDIFAAAVASGSNSADKFKQTAQQLGVSADKLNSAEALGNLLAVPDKVKELLDENTNDDDEANDKQRDINKDELAPKQKSGEVASPS